MGFIKSKRRPIVSGLSQLSDENRRFLQPSRLISPLPMTAVVLMDALPSSGGEEHRLQLCEILNSFGLSVSSV